VAFGEDFIDVFFQRPRHTHPPARLLINHGIGPQVALDLGLDIITVFKGSHAHVVSGFGQDGVGEFGQANVQCAFRVGKGFTCVNNQNVAHKYCLIGKLLSNSLLKHWPEKNVRYSTRLWTKMQ